MTNNRYNQSFLSYSFSSFLSGAENLWPLSILAILGALKKKPKLLSNLENEMSANFWNNRMKSGIEIAGKIYLHFDVSKNF